MALSSRLRSCARCSLTHERNARLRKSGAGAGVAGSAAGKMPLHSSRLHCAVVRPILRLTTFHGAHLLSETTCNQTQYLVRSPSCAQIRDKCSVCPNTSEQSVSSQQCGDLLDNASKMSSPDASSLIKGTSFEPNAILRGVQLTLVSAYRALQNPALFTSDHYRQAALAVAAGIAIRLLVAIPVR